MKLLQILYPGLGGHSSVAFSLIEGDYNAAFLHTLVGFGIESPSKLFIAKANELKVNFEYVVKSRGFDIKSQYRIYKLLKKHNPDAIIMHSTSLVFVVWIYCFLYKKKWIAVEHQSNHAKGVIDWIYTFFILYLASLIAYLTPKYKEEICKKFRFISRKKIKIISNGINIEKYDLPVKQTPPHVITMISRINALRDHKTLIDAFKSLLEKYDLKLYIAGDGNLLNTHKEYVNNTLKLQDKVYFTGALNEDEIINLLKKTDVYVHSSLAENLSTSLLQIMASKIPIVATDIDGINNLLEDEVDALLFQPQNAEQLSKQIEIIINNNSIREQLALNSYKKVVMKYNNRDMFNQYKSLLYP